MYYVKRIFLNFMSTWLEKIWVPSLIFIHFPSPYSDAVRSSAVAPCGVVPGTRQPHQQPVSGHPAAPDDVSAGQDTHQLPAGAVHQARHHAPVRSHCQRGRSARTHLRVPRHCWRICGNWKRWVNVLFRPLLLLNFQGSKLCVGYVFRCPITSSKATWSKGVL